MKFKFLKKWQVIPYDEKEATTEQIENGEEIKLQNILKNKNLAQDKYQNFNQKFKEFYDKKSNIDNKEKKQIGITELEDKSKTDLDTKPDHYETLEKKIDQMSNSNNNEFVKLYDNINTILSNIKTPNEDLYRMVSHSTRSKKRNRLDEEIDQISRLKVKRLGTNDKTKNKSVLKTPTKNSKKKKTPVVANSLLRWENSSGINQTGNHNNPDYSTMSIDA